MRTLGILFSAVLSLSATVFSACAMTPGGIQKKFIALASDVTFSTPSDIVSHSGELNSVAWLDGLAIPLSDIEIPLKNGGKVRSDSLHLIKRGHKWTRESIAPQLKYFRQIVKSPRLKDSFLLVRITPSEKKDRLCWNDEMGWRLFAQNMGNLAWFAKESQLKGLMLDPKEYVDSLQYRYMKGEAGSFEKCAQLARERGRQVFAAVFKEFPQIDLFFLQAFERSVRLYSNSAGKNPKELSDNDGELLPYFLNGMLDVMPKEARFVDGAENYELSVKDGTWMKCAVNQIAGAKPFVAPENWAKYRAQILVGNTHLLDMYSQNADPKSDLYFGPVAGSRLEHLRLNLESSLRSADKYVLVRGEEGRLIDWKTPLTRRQNSSIPLWEANIPGLTDLMVFVKDPKFLAAMKIKELRSKGELKNLFAGKTTLPRVFELKDVATYTECTNAPSVKDVRRGEIYHVTLRYRARIKEGEPKFKIVWLSGGKRVLREKEEIIVDDPDQKTDSWRTARATAVVPQGADELFVSVSAGLYPGDAVAVESIMVARVDLSPEEKSLGKKPAVCESETPPSNRKWTYDAAKKKLTDGNWILTANERKKDGVKKTLDVDGKNAVGAGVLDFRRLEADTGMKAVAIGGFANNAAITELIAPDVKAVKFEGFRACRSLSRVQISAEFTSVGPSAFTWSPNLSDFSPRVFSQSSWLGISAFMGCRNLKGDFYYEGTNAVASSLFAHTAIRSFRAPRVEILQSESFINNTNLAFVSFAETKNFNTPKERADYLISNLRKSGALRNLIPRKKSAVRISTIGRFNSKVRPVPVLDGVKPGELYALSVSMKATSHRSRPEIMVVWRYKGALPDNWFLRRQLSIDGPRENGVWRRASTVLRIPNKVDKMELHISVTGVSTGESYEFDNIELYKLADPPPKWPSETEREKE